MNTKSTGSTARTASPTARAVRTGVRRGAIEFTNSVRAGVDIGYYVFTAVVFVAVLWFNRTGTLAGTTIEPALYMLPGVLALTVLVSAAFGLATAVTTEREDGTLLRLKSVPGGLVGYVTGQVVRVFLEVLLSALLVLLPALLIVPGLTDHAGAVGAVAAVGFLLLGLLALTPVGFAVGSVFKNPRSVGGWGMLVVGALVYVSGIFLPLASLPGWAQAIGQVVPTTWLGVGMRWSLLPPEAGAAELGGSFQPLVAVAVLVGWAVVGLLLAPRLLRRMARRESGSAVLDRRSKALSRV